MQKAATSFPRPVIGIIGVLLISLLFVLFIQLTPTTPPANSPRFAEKVNLALRRTAHHLLVKAGDTTSRIPPVQQADDHTFMIRLERAFDYQPLPALLQASLDRHGISTPYDVAVLDCAKGELQLGYTIRDLTGQEPVPCGGRDQQSGCYTLKVTFTPPEAVPPQTSLWWVLAITGLFAGVAYTVWRNVAPSAPSGPAPVVAASDSPQPLRFGNSSFDPANQRLMSGTTQHELTYREAKLLHLFVSHPNQVLEREYILKSVWEDEGIIVGRSADVFVSRLRKLLQADPAVRIAAVHGVGYRLEIRPDNQA
ncbi:hypothetical protein GCM10023189_22420 [Nibrella saemangeumensis]|uniref:OmpR/PhoB-type domain-containing protein n=1 Tax=Nibrella saemangeumensis TaxID=1084526 RepID=A0ABP8MUA2_9BACT